MKTEWYCAHCQMVVDSFSVTFQEEHDTRKGGCGQHLEWRRAIDLRCPNLGGDECSTLGNLNEQLLAAECKLASTFAKLREVEGERDKLWERMWFDTCWNCGAELKNYRDKDGCCCGCGCDGELEGAHEAMKEEIANLNRHLAAAREDAVRGFAEWLGEIGHPIVLDETIDLYIASLAGKEPSE